jgi:flagellar biosynthesis/type III secretory pathway M-ring protein FliF/YscJ
MLVVSSGRWWLASAAVSLIIFLIVYFTVIKPDSNAANNALRSGEQQVQQAVKSLNSSGVKVPAGVTNLTSCLAAAGTDTGKIEACQSKFKP